jgi:hypothetical protein
MNLEIHGGFLRYCICHADEFQKKVADLASILLEISRVFLTFLSMPIHIPSTVYTHDDLAAVWITQLRVSPKLLYR